jgi:hypothetical protein
MKYVLGLGVIAGLSGLASLGACASSSGGSGGGAGGGGGYGTGGAAAGGSSAGGSSAGGSSAGGSSAGGSSSGGGSSVSLPSGCVTGVTAQCNPVTNDGCDGTAGEACDLGEDSSGKPGFGCFPAPNTQKLGETCSNGQSGPFCQGTLHCSGETDAGGGSCKKFCCSSSDCGGGACTALDSQLGTVGVCG